MAEVSFASGSPRRRSGLLRDQVKLSKRKDGARYEIVPIQESLSFEKGFFVMIRACQLLAQNNEGMIFAGVAGPSGAGKTVFTEKVLSFMPSIAVLSMDNYNDASRIIDGNFDDPRLTDYDTLLQNIHDLREGKPIQVPIYDFKTSSRIGYRTVEVPNSRIVIIEGIYALNEKLRPFLDLRVSVTGGVHFDLVKRVLRDIQRAGQEPEEIIHQISETVYPMYKAFIEPDLQTAHIKITNKFNPFTGFQNPTYILKSSKTVPLDDIKAVISEDHTEKSEETYDIYLLPPGEDHEACQSYLRMRNRDGKYNLMFEEWVTDTPFIISPRISFEVSVRLLGGLMALGYTIATILKRSSHIFFDDKVIVKIDWLEQLGRHYLQVQGRDRHVVKLTAEKLGLEASYVSRTYIEQIQLEKIANEVMALPDDLKTKLSVNDELSVNSKDALSRASADMNALREHMKSAMSQSYPEQRDNILLSDHQISSNGTILNRRTSEYPVSSKESISELSKKIAMLNKKMDMFTVQMDDLSSKISCKSSQENLALRSEVCNGSASTSEFLSGAGNRKFAQNSSSYSQLPKDSPLMEEITILCRSQRQMMHQLDNLSSLVHKRIMEPTHLRSKESRDSSILDSDAIRSPLIWTLALGGFGIFLFRGLYQA